MNTVTTQHPPGISVFGAQIIDIPPGHETTSHSGQQGLYVALSGHGGVVVAAEFPECLLLNANRVVAVGPAVERTLVAGPEGMRVLCIGGAPGKPYEAPDWTRG